MRISPDSRSARTACTSCSIPPTAASGTRTSTARIAGRGTASCSAAVRSRRDDDARLAAVRRLPARIRRSRRTAASMRSRSRATSAGPATFGREEALTPARGDRGGRGVAADRRDRRRERNRRLPSGVRRAKTGGKRAARAEVPQRAAVRGDGARSRGGTDAGRTRRRCRAPADGAGPADRARAGSKRRDAGGRTGERRVGRHAAVHAAASSAVRGGRAAVLVLTSANRSSEPIAYLDEDALRRSRASRMRFSWASVRSRAGSTTRSCASDRRGRSMLRRARGLAPQAVADSERVADSGRGRGFEERGRAGRRRTGVREPAHRRSRPLRHARGVRNDGTGPVRHVRSGCGGLDGRARLASAISVDAVRGRVAGGAVASPCSITARTSPACWRSAERGRRKLPGSRSTARATARTARSGAARSFADRSRRAHARRTSAARACSRRGCRGALSGTGRGGVSSRHRRRRVFARPPFAFPER